MKLKNLLQLLLLTSSVWLWGAVSVTAQEVAKPDHDKTITSVLRKSRLIREIPQIGERERPSTSAIMLVQSPAPTNPSSVQRGVIQVTGVQANPTAQGVEVILQTTQGEQLQITNRSAGNNLIADIPNAQLRLPNGDAFTFNSQKPIEGITEITVTNLDANTIRVTVAGETGLPTVELFDSDEGLIFSLIPAATAMQPPQQPEGEQPTSETPQETPAAQQDDLIEILVTGQQDTGYSVPDATTGTRLDIPLLETPASIGTITRELIEDTDARRGEDLIPYISGVARGATNPQGGANPQFTVRGFDVSQQATYLNGLRDNNRFVIRDLANIERIEILKGFSSLLYGVGSPGGVVNYVTKKPQAIPSYTTSFEAGSFDFYRGEIDLTGPLNQERNLLYRLVVGLQNAGSFYDNVEDNRILVAPSFTWLTGNDGSLTVEAEYLQQSRDAVGTVFFDGSVLFDRSYTDPRNDVQRDNYRISAYFDQPVGNNWSINLSGHFFDTTRDETVFTAISFNESPLENTLQRFYRELFDEYNQLNLRAEVRGNFNIGASQHRLLAGVDYNRSFLNISGPGFAFFGSIDPDNPTFDVPIPSVLTPSSFSEAQSEYGIYVQDFITLGRFRLLAGLRYGGFRSEFNDELSFDGNFLAPSLGLLYNLTDSASVYASYSRSTEPQGGRFANNEFVDPRTATQYEIGAKANFFDERLSVTAALFELTQTNLAEPDPLNPDFNILVGEVRSRGLELDVAGKITDNFSLIATYTLLDAEITESTTGFQGNRPASVPRNSASLWGKYDFTQGALTGLSLAAGLIYVGDRQGDSENTFDVPGYVRVDLAAAYQVDNLTFRLGIENLFDERYVESSSDTANVFQGSPLAVTGSVTVRF